MSEASEHVRKSPTGRRGVAMQRNLLNAVCLVLWEKPLRDVKVKMVADVVRTSTATFYQYFPSLNDAVLVLGAEVAGKSMRIFDVSNLDKPLVSPQLDDVLRRDAGWLVELFHTEIVEPNKNLLLALVSLTIGGEDGHASQVLRDVMLPLAKALGVLAGGSLEESERAELSAASVLMLSVALSEGVLEEFSDVSFDLVVENLVSVVHGLWSVRQVES